jgi:hypothetical protein
LEKINKIELRNEKKLLFIFWYTHTALQYFSKHKKKEKCQPSIFIQIKTPLSSGCGYMQIPVLIVLGWFTNAVRLSNACCCFSSGSIHMPHTF